MEVSAYNETFALPAAGADDSELARLLAVLDAMQETAGRHAGILGVGVRDLHAKGLTWVLTRLHVQVQSVPAAGRTVHIATWPSGRHRLFALREFRLNDPAGDEILKATSAWALMNMETRRPARLDPHLPVFSRTPERMISDDFPPLPPLAPGGAPARFNAVAADIDINDHVNNTVYMDWALRAIPGEVRARQPLAMEAAFLGEARLGDEILCHSQSSADNGNAVICQSLLAAKGGRELTRLRWTFRKPA
jgi:medium-chain acyl-[acyl-carrier-protein] hydrolase